MSPRATSACLALALVTMVGARVHAARVRVDGTVATITTANQAAPRVILYSDLELRARLRIAGEASIEAPERVTLDDGLLRDAFREAVSESLLYVEAQRVQVAPPTQPMIDAEWRRFFRAVGGPARLERVRRAMSAPEDEISAIVEQRAWIAAFLEANLEGADDIDAETVERVYESGEHPFRGLSLEEAREPIRDHLRMGRIAEAVRSWVDALRGRARLVISPAWAPLLDHPFESVE